MGATGQAAPKRASIHPGRTRLEATAMPETYRIALQKFGYITIEQVASIAEMAEPRVNEYLKTDVRKILAALPTQPKAAQLSIETKLAKYKLGATLKQPVRSSMPRLDLHAGQHVPVTHTAPLSATGAFGSTPDVNLIPGMMPVRNQGKRGTCVAHAAVAAMEYWLGASGRQTDLSEQFLYWNCKRNDGAPNIEGTSISVAMPLLFTDGCCQETVWPYNPLPQAGNEGQGPPPTGSSTDASSRKTPGAKQLTPQAVSEVKDELAANRCVVVSVPVYDGCWFTEEIRSSGDITLPFEGEFTNEAHAVCLVGYEDLAGEPQLGGGRFILRNSWDSLWGVNCEFGTGYGTLPYTYLTTYGMEAYSID